MTARATEDAALLALALANYRLALARLTASTATDYRDARLVPTSDGSTRIANGASTDEALAAMAARDLEEPPTDTAARAALRASLPGYLGPYAGALYKVIAPSTSSSSIGRGSLGGGS